MRRKAGQSVGRVRVLEFRISAVILSEAKNLCNPLGAGKLHRSFATKTAAQDDRAFCYDRVSANARQLLPAQHVDDAVAADTALQHDRGARSSLPLFRRAPSLPRPDTVFITSSAASACAPGTKTAKRPSFATYSGSSPRISQALCTVSCTGIRALFQLDADIPVGGDLVQRRCQAAARQVAQAVHFDSGIQQRLNRRPDRSRVAQDRRFEFQALAHGENRNAMPSQIAADDHRVANLNRRRADRSLRRSLRSGQCQRC